MEILQALNDKNQRYELCRNSLYLFGLYYFRKYFTHISPEFHKERCKIIQSLGNIGNPRYMTDCEFRGSAKSSLAKIDFIRRICYKDRQMMLYGSLDKSVAEDSLLDIAIELQTNSLLIADFGQLFYDTNNKEKKSKKSGIADFLTSNGVRVQAITTGQPIRGRIFGSVRPDYIIYDDFENNKTKKSNALTRQVIGHFDEMFPAIAPYGIVIFLCNKISDTGSVAWLYDKFENNPDGVIYEKAVIENGKIIWTDKYVMTDKEAQEININRDKQRIVTSLEALKRTMNKDGRKIFEQEMLNQPLVDGERFFDIKKIDQALEEAKQKEFIKDGNWKIWQEYNPIYEYKIGGDVSEGYGLDSSVIEVINITTGEQVAEFESNQIPPGELADEFIQASLNYGSCTITPERNSIGNAVITSIQEKHYGYLLTRQKVINKKGGGNENRYGWHTNGTSKPKMLFDFQRDFNDNSLIIYSIPLLREMRAFANGDLKIISFDDEISNHFDRVIAMSITNQTKIMRGEFAIKEKSINMGESPAIVQSKISYAGRGRFKIN